MYMLSPSERMESVVCVVLYLLCVLCVSGTEHTLQLSNSYLANDNLIADFGSNVTLVCDTTLVPSKRVAWYKSSLPAALADMLHTNDKCEMNMYNHSRLYKLDCTNTYFRIIIGNIQKEDEGKWYCAGRDGISSQTLNISVNMNVETTTSSEIGMTRMTSRTASTRRYSATNLLTEVTISTLETVRTNQPEIGEESFMDPPNENWTAVIGGVVGGVVVLVVIVTIVTMVLRRRRNSHLVGEEKPNDNDRLDDGKDGLEVAENLMYEAYEQRDGAIQRSLTSDYDHVADVYSVVQKPLKSQSSSSDGGKDSKSPGTDGNGTDVYSVVQKPLKLQGQGSALDDIKDSLPSGPDEVGDVYSVVQKPTEGQKTNGSSIN